MPVCFAFRYQDREYYGELESGDTMIMGSGKNASIKIPGAAEKVLVIRHFSGKVAA